MMGNNLCKARQGYCLGDRSQSWVAVPVLSFTQPARILLPCSTWRIFVSANSNSLGFYSFTSQVLFFVSFSCVSVIHDLVSFTFIGKIHSWGVPKGSQVAIYFVDFLSRLACWVTCLQPFHYQNLVLTGYEHALPRHQDAQVLIKIIPRRKVSSVSVRPSTGFRTTFVGRQRRRQYIHLWGISKSF